MKNKQEILGLAANIVLVAFVFCFIVAGLNILGIYSLPAPIEKLLGTYENDGHDFSDDSSKLYNSVSFDENMGSLNKVDLSFVNAKEILEGLEAAYEYSHVLSVTHFYGNASRTEVFNVTRERGDYSVIITDSVGAFVKRIEEDSENVYIYETANGEAEPASFVKGSFTVSDECGFVLTAREFLESGYELSSADYSGFTNEYGACISVSFDRSVNGKQQRMVYVISLDYGVVTEVSCVEDGVVVYSMNTDSLMQS